MFNFGAMFPRVHCVPYSDRPAYGAEIEFLGYRVVTFLPLFQLGPVFNNELWWDNQSPEILAGFHEEIGIEEVFPLDHVPSWLLKECRQQELQDEIDHIDQRILRGAW